MRWSILERFIEIREMVDLTHKGICDLAAKWLKRHQSQNGHGCAVAVTEAPSGWNGEIPDAIGFRIAGHHDGSIVVEVKVSRSDFLADKNKPHRASDTGLGNWRYYLCPEGLIHPADLPNGWGLLWVNSRGHIKAKAGAAAYFSEGYGVMCEQLSAWRQVSNLNREQWLLVKLLSRVGDVEQMNRWIREANTERSRIAKMANDLRDENRNMRLELQKCRRSARAADEAAMPRVVEIAND